MRLQPSKQPKRLVGALHHRHEKSNQNSKIRSSALFALRLGMPLNVVSVDTTVRSEHTSCTWIARGCT